MRNSKNTPLIFTDLIIFITTKIINDKPDYQYNDYLFLVSFIDQIIIVLVALCIFALTILCSNKSTVRNDISCAMFFV